MPHAAGRNDLPFDKLSNGSSACNFALEIGRVGRCHVKHRSCSSPIDQPVWAGHQRLGIAAGGNTGMSTNSRYTNGYEQLGKRGVIARYCENLRKTATGVFQGPGGRIRMRGRRREEALILVQFPQVVFCGLIGLSKTCHLSCLICRSRFANRATSFSR